MDQHVALICISEGTPSGELQTKENLKARIRIKTSFMFWKKMINREINYVKGHPVELKGPQKCPIASCIIPFHMCIGIRICSSWYIFGAPFGLPTPSEVSLSRIVSPKKAVFRAFFLENHVFDPFRPNEDPQVLYMAGKLWISSFW